MCQTTLQAENVSEFTKLKYKKCKMQNAKCKIKKHGHPVDAELVLSEPAKRVTAT